MLANMQKLKLKQLCRIVNSNHHIQISWFILVLVQSLHSLLHQKDMEYPGHCQSCLQTTPPHMTDIFDVHTEFAWDFLAMYCTLHTYTSGPNWRIRGSNPCWNSASLSLRTMTPCSWNVFQMHVCRQDWNLRETKYKQIKCCKSNIQILVHIVWNQNHIWIHIYFDILQHVFPVCNLKKKT